MSDVIRALAIRNVHLNITHQLNGWLDTLTESGFTRDEAMKLVEQEVAHRVAVLKRTVG
jgi:hypothetical protein